MQRAAMNARCRFSANPASLQVTVRELLMLCLSGANALSNFRQEQLLKQLRSVDPLFQAVSARYVYFVELEATEGVPVELDLTHLQRLCSLLQADEHFRTLSAGWQINVVPRLGTRSAWSSKASDIAGRCGMSAVRRVERGVQYHFHDLEPGSLSQESLG